MSDTAPKPPDSENLCPKCSERGQWYSAASYRAAVEGGLQVGRENADLKEKLDAANQEIARLTREIESVSRCGDFEWILEGIDEWRKGDVGAGDVLDAIEKRIAMRSLTARGKGGS